MAALTSLLARKAGNRRGNALIEFALVLPLLLLVFAGIVDFGFLFQRYEVLTNAVREGARVAVLPGSYDAAARVTAYVEAGLGSSAALTAVSVNPGTSGTPGISVVTVSATLTYDYVILDTIMNLFGGGWDEPLALTATSVMRSEVAP
jgi:Flp pilus assembly protein TadG